MTAALSNGAVSVTRDVLACAEHVAAGGLLGLPTETVYGLAADAQNDAAVQAVFALKGRPADHPLIVHVAPDVAGAEPGWSFFALQAPDWAQALMQAFWPGPLTLVLPRRPGVAGVMAAHLPTVAVRCPAHPLAQQVLVAARARGVMGLAAPSANRFGRISPTLPSHVVDEFAAHTTGAVLRVLDGGPSQVGIESTIVDASRDHPVLLRPGMIERTSLEAVLGRPLASADGNAPRVSGAMASHYAPRTPLRVLSAAALAEALPTAGPEVAVYASATLRALAPAVPGFDQPQQATACAHELFAVLRAMDAMATRVLWVQQPPPDVSWDGVRDRLSRAAHPA